MPFFPPSSIPQVTFAPYTSHPRHSVGTLHYEQDYNHDLTGIKVQLRNILKQNNLSEVRAGFPFQFVHRYGREPAMSYDDDYEFEFREHFHSSEQRSGLRSVTFKYSSPSPRPGSHMMHWSIVVPERQSLRHSHYTPGTSVCRNSLFVLNRPFLFQGIVSIAHVQVDPPVMETKFGITFMTNPRVLQEALALSIELGALITIQLANRKTPNHSPGEILFLTTDSHGRSQVVCAYTR